MGISIETLVAAKKFTSETVLGGGAVVGKNVTISSITPINGGNRITFSYTLDNETAKTSTLDVMNGVNGADGKDGKAFTYDDFTEEQLEVLKVKGDKGDSGKDAVSPTITENENNTDTIYKLDVTTVDGTFTTPNLRGKDGENGSGSSTGEENVIESIKVNGVAQTVAEDKSVDITCLLYTSPSPRDCD